jgi:hypothetical protein
MYDMRLRCIVVVECTVPVCVMCVVHKKSDTKLRWRWDKFFHMCKNDNKISMFFIWKKYPRFLQMFTSKMTENTFKLKLLEDI